MLILFLAGFDCVILTNNYKNKVIQRRGAETNGAMALFVSRQLKIEILANNCFSA